MCEGLLNVQTPEAREAAAKSEVLSDACIGLTITGT